MGELAGTTATIRYEIRDGAAWLVLNRPDRLNAISGEMIDDLHRLLSEIEQDDAVTSAVLSGAGRAFCAGADLTFLDALPEESRQSGALDFIAAAGAVMNRLEHFPKPVICALNGVAVAGGLELLLCCDLVVASKSARIADGHARYGFLPGAGGSIRLPRKIGVTRAKMMLFTGDFYDAAEMMDAGLVNKVVAADQLEEAVAALCARLSDKSPLGLRRMKELVGRGLDLPLADALAFEWEMNRLHIASFDRDEGLRAFNEGRSPAFTGR